MKEINHKVGRPKLAGKTLKKESIIVSAICFVIAIVLGFCGTYIITNSSTKTLKASSWNLVKDEKTYKALSDKKILMFGTSIGYGVCTITDSNGKCLKPGNGYRYYPFIKMIADKNNMKLNNKAYSGCGGVYERKKVYRNGYFKGGHSRCNGVMSLSKKTIQNYDYIIIEGFANDAENSDVSISTFKDELNSALKYLKNNKKSSTKVIVVATPKLPDIYKKYRGRQVDMWNAAKTISNNNGAYYCGTYSVNAHYTKYSKDHPTYNGHLNIAERVEKCMLKAK